MDTPLLVGSGFGDAFANLAGQLDHQQTPGAGAPLASATPPAQTQIETLISDFAAASVEWQTAAQFLESSSGGITQTRFGTYSLSLELQAQRFSAAIEVPPGLDLSQTPDDPLAWLGSVSPRAAAELELLLRSLGEDSEAAARILGNLRSVQQSLQGGGSAEIDIAVTNVQASFSAQSGAITPPASGEGALTGGAWSVSVEGGVFQLNVNQGDPLVLDIAGNGIDLRSADDGVLFDLEGKGVAVRTAFVQGDDALLYLDHNGDGALTDGLELFGDQSGHAHGFAELGDYDDNRDGVIDAKDRVFTRLRAFQDHNGNGRSDHGESHSLSDLGIASIDLHYQDTHLEDGKGNTITQAATFTREDGSRGLVADALFRYEEA